VAEDENGMHAKAGHPVFEGGFHSGKVDWSLGIYLLGYFDGAQTPLAKGQDPRRTRLY
jgi:hypothetical protein